MNIRKAPPTLIIKLPTGDTTVITHIGDVRLDNKLILHNMLYVPQFQHNLLSIHKLAADNNCVVHFSPGNCKIVDNTSKTVKAIGTVQNGLNYLKQTLHQQNPSRALQTSVVSTSDSTFDVWHHRLGHAPLAKLKHIPSSKKVCTILQNRSV